MNPKPTSPEPTVVALVLTAALIWMIARVIAYLIGRNDETKRTRGLFVPEWIAFLYIGLGLFGMVVLDQPGDPYPPSMTLPGVALIAGPIIGLVHGTILLGMRRNIDSASTAANRIPEDGNPYRPP